MLKVCMPRVGTHDKSGCYSRDLRLHFQGYLKVEKQAKGEGEKSQKKGNKESLLAILAKNQCRKQ